MANLILDLGCFNSCDDVCLPIISDTTCIVNLQFYRLGGLVRVPISLQRNQYIKFPSKYLNEYSEFAFKIFYPDGTQVAIVLDDVTYSEFKIKISPLTIISDPYTPTFCITEDCGSYICNIKD